jgi:riboflavin synthase
MFTGLIEELGTVRRVVSAGRSLHLTVGARRVLQGVRAGDSIAVNGVCLTVVRFDGDSFTADVMPETFERTNLRGLVPGAPVNLERTMALGGRFGGHIVQGHVDGTGTIAAMALDEIAVRVAIKAPPDIIRYVAPKGSIAVDGISLTVVNVGEDRFTVSIIPHTAAVTTISRRQVGDTVNLERTLRIGDRLGGHMVSGHIDGVGTIKAKEENDNAVVVRVAAPVAVMRYIVAKGSIAVDGISLTVVAAGPDWFTVSLIPHTASVTTLGIKGVGAPVNLEVDVIGKYVEKLLGMAPQEGTGKGGLSAAFLADHGFTY